MRRIVVADPKKCYACLTCVVECAYNKADADPSAPLTANLISHANVAIEAVEDVAVPLLCHHCEDAPCITVCPTGAVSREDEEAPVIVDQELCIGCKACIVACPFGLMRLSPEGKTAVKCDLCIDRLKRGELPVCVTSCPSGALELKTVEEVQAEARKRAAEAIVKSESVD